MIQVFGNGVATTVLALTETVELDLRLMIGGIGVLGAPYSIPILLDRLVAGRLEGIEVGPVSDLDL